MSTKTEFELEFKSYINYDNQVNLEIKLLQPLSDEDYKIVIGILKDLRSLARVYLVEPEAKKEDKTKETK